MTAGLASSYDRAGANMDWNHYESPAGHLNAYDVNDPDNDDHDIVTTVTTLTGPGVITRFWMPHATADSGAGGVFPVKITVDGTLAIDTDTDALLGGTYNAANTALFKGPLVTTLIGGQVCYEPIPFQNSLVIETKNYVDPPTGGPAGRHYYQYNHYRLPSTTQVTAYDGALTGAQTAARASTVDMLNNVGANPAGTSVTSTVVNTAGQSIGAGRALSLGTIGGRGVIRRLNVKMTGAGDGDLDGLRLRIRYDGEGDNAVDVPVSQFFGAGHERVAYQSLPLGTIGDDGFYCYWPMPYRQGAVVELYNSTGGSIAIDSAIVEYEPGAVPASAGYFHAVYRTDNSVGVDGQPLQYHQLLDVSGQGHYVGNLLNLRREGTSRWMLEGDDLILVDGGDASGGVTLYGTGLEDCYNGGYYYNHVVDQSDDGDIPDPTSGVRPFHGLLIMEDADSGATYVRTDQYRWLIADAVPFSEGIEVFQERHTGGETVFDSTAFYYIGVPEPTSMLILSSGLPVLFSSHRRRQTVRS